MKKLGRRIAWGAIVALLIGMILIAGRWLIWTERPLAVQGVAQRAVPTPTPLPTAIVPGNVLTNPSLEGPYSSQQYPEINVPKGWTAWYFDIPPCKPWKPGCYIPCPVNCVENGACVRDYGCMWARPEFVPIFYQQVTYRVHTGETAQKYFSYGRMHEGGLYQRVTGITPGAQVEFSAWIQTWMCFNFDDCAYGRVSDQPSDMHLRIGIDPTGGTVPTSTNIIWSPEAPAFDQWTYFSVRAVAQASTVTVFTHSRPEWGWARKNNDVYLDDANLVVLTPSAEFSLIQPAQPELGQVTTVQATSSFADLAPTLAITDPRSMPMAPTGGAKSGSGPYTWTWQFTPTVSGTHTLVLSATALLAPVTSTLRAVAVAHLMAQPSTAWLSQTVTVRASAYYLYPSHRLTVTAPGGSQIATSDDGIISGGLYTHTWRFASIVTGTHPITFTADGLDTLVTTTVNVTSVAGVHSLPPAPPINTPVTIQAWAYYPYANVALTLTDPQGAAFTPAFVGRTGDSPFVWEWRFTPVITGTHVYTFSAAMLDVPARGLIFAGGHAIYLPLIFRQ